MSEDLCGQRYEYDDRICDFPKDHNDDPDHHRAGAFHWLHHEESYTDDKGEECWETWDEPIDSLNEPREPGIAPHTIKRIGLMNAPSVHFGSHEAKEEG